MSKSIAIITARGGSKRIPGKNIKDFCGKPIIEYSISAALESECFDEVMVSTDDDRIAEIAEKAGAKVPFMRSRENSDDFAVTSDVLYEVLKHYEVEGRIFEIGCCIYPTAPFITAAKISTAMELLKKCQAQSVMPVTLFSFPPQRGVVVDENGFIRMKEPEYLNIRSQDIEKVYHDAGQFYCFDVEAFKKQRKLLMEKTVPYILRDIEVQDIDNIDDWVLAEVKYKLWSKGGEVI